VNWLAKIAVRPTSLSIKLTLGLAVLAGVIGVVRIFAYDAGFLPSGTQLFWYSLVAFLVMSLVDLLNRPNPGLLECHRFIPTSFALNRPQTVRFEIENHSKQKTTVTLNDATPEHFYSRAFPLSQEIENQQKGVFEYSVIPKRRGLASFAPAYVLVKSGWGLWEFRYRLGQADTAKVYPDFSAVSNSVVLGVEQAMRNMGAHIAKRRGDGMEFHQLREFREGDTLKQIDWKATARTGTPISREYQEEKDQNIVFLLDCSRRMRALENNLSYFDYALNALLMSSYIALDKGDAVGVMAFSGEPSWLSPIKGKTSVNTLLNHLYDLHTSTQSSDYVEAAEQLLLRQRKRSLVILLSNLRDEDKSDLIQAVEILRQRHLVMVVGLREQLIQGAQTMQSQTQADVLLYAGIKHFEVERSKLLALLRAKGVSVVDASNKNLHIQLVNEYLRLKRSGRI